MKPGIAHAGAAARTTLQGLLATGVMAIAMLAPADEASAAPCAGGSTSWNGGSGSFNVDANWSNGGSSAACDTLITAPGTYTVSMTSGAVMKSLALGGAGSSPTLEISAVNPNTDLNAGAGTGGIAIETGATVVLTCPLLLDGGCLGGSTGGSSLSSGSSPFANQGTIRVAAASGTGATIAGPLVNTGIVKIEQDTRLNDGAVVNKGAFNIVDGKTLTSKGDSCGDASVSFENDTDGSIDATGTGKLSVVNYEQGNGTTSGSLPVSMPCGTLGYTGNGASIVQANGGIGLSGEMKANQQLTVSAASPNTIASVAGGSFTNNGSITLTCPAFGCEGGSGGGAGFNANGNTFTNAGTFTVASSSGTGVRISGGLTNTGTMQFDQGAVLKDVITNQGAINIAAGKTVASFGDSCGDGAAKVINDTGGSINAAGTGTLSVNYYAQGNGTTSGIAPVTMPCGALEYIGTGASTVQVEGTVPMTGAPAAGQALRIVGTVNAPSTFTNAGTIALAGGGTLSVGNTVTNAGRLAGVGTVTGSVDNTTGAVAPGSSPGTLTVNGGYAQGAGGSLEIEIAGTGAGQFDKLAIGGGATLNGTLALLPTSGYASSAAPGDGIDFLTYGSTRAGQFAQVTTTPSLACPKQFALDYADGEKRVGVDVLDGPFSCGGDGGGGSGTGDSSPAVTPPPTSTPPPRSSKPLKCKKGFRKAKVKGKPRCVKIKRKGKKGRGKR